MKPKLLDYLSFSCSHQWIYLRNRNTWSPSQKQQVLSPWQRTTLADAAEEMFNGKTNLFSWLKRQTLKGQGRASPPGRMGYLESRSRFQRRRPLFLLLLETRAQAQEGRGAARAGQTAGSPKHTGQDAAGASGGERPGGGSAGAAQESGPRADQ